MQLSNLGLRAKVLGFCLIIGMLPVVVTSYLAHGKAASSLESSALESSEALENQVVDRLAAVRDRQANNVEEYFDSVRYQIEAFSTNGDIVEALEYLPDLYVDYLDNLDITEDDVKRMREELMGFYSKEFDGEYQRIQGRGFARLQKVVDGLSARAVALQHAYIQKNSAALGTKDTMDAASDGSLYSDYHGMVHPTLRGYQFQFGLDDILLCRSGTGEVIYSVFKEIDFATQLTDGPFSDSGLGDVFRRADALAEGEAPAFTDFSDYDPSYGTPAGFIGAPVFKDGDKLGVVIFRLPTDAASKILAGAAGLGETGDCYLVGPDGLMRSDSRQDPTHRSMEASFRNPALGKCQSDAVGAAHRGESGAGFVDNYAGAHTVAAWKPIEVLGTPWVLVAEVTTEEGLAVVATIREHSEANIAELVQWIIGSVAVVLVLVLLTGFAAARRFVRPIQHASDTIEAMGQGELTSRIHNTGQDEIGRMTRVVDSVLDQLVEVFGADSVEWVELGESIQKASGLAGMIEQAALNMMRVDLHGRITYVNRAAREAMDSARFISVPNSGPEGAMVRDLLHIPPAIDGQMGVAHLPWTHEYKVGEDFVELTASAVEGADGTAQGIMVTWTIRTSERQVEERVSQTTAELNNFAGSLRNSARELLAAAEATSESAARTQEGTREVNDDTQAVSSASDEMSNTVSSIAQSSRDLADAVEEAVMAGGKAVEVVGSLTSANDQISRVSDTIANIADQTNLLALNATIEAAGAGEAGRGFAVVASEVKDLARETMAATDSISDQVRDIAGRSQEVSAAIDDITRVVAGVSDLALTLSTAVEEQDITTREISEATSRSASRVGSITSEMEELSSSAESANTGARSVMEAAERLNQLAKDLA
ncbi:MAG: methyl-accepting chemotaxis protein, partial [Planctomycetota bacterium]|nr:methyl-accepting chemotaxis protein [Planctomycetota bacterium]